MMRNPCSRLARSIARSIASRVTLAIFALATLAFAADSRLLSLLPANSEAVVGVDVQAILSSGLAQEFMKSTPESTNSLAEFTAMTGVDPKRDIRSVLFAGYTPPAASGAPKPGGAVGLGFISGTFDPPASERPSLRRAARRNPTRATPFTHPKPKRTRTGTRWSSSTPAQSWPAIPLR